MCFYDVCGIEYQYFHLVKYNQIIFHSLQFILLFVERCDLIQQNVDVFEFTDIDVNHFVYMYTLILFVERPSCMCKFIIKHKIFLYIVWLTFFEMFSFVLEKMTIYEQNCKAIFSLVISFYSCLPNDKFTIPFVLT